MKFALLFILLTSSFLSQSQEVAADENGSSTESAVSKNEENSNREQVEKQAEKKLTPEQQQRRKQILSASWIMLVGIAILGGILLLMVFIIGSRLRRIARKPLPDAPLRDPMWYLKNKAPDEPGTTDEPADTDLK